ncbi:ATP-binding protein [Streptomyces sp. NPDC055078]
MTLFATRSAGRTDQRSGTDRSCLFELPALGRSVTVARRIVRSYLDGYARSEDLRESAALVISELVTNAVRHTGGLLVTCCVQLEARAVRIEVEDQGSVGAHIRPHVAAADEARGRGLYLVEAVAKDWGVRSRGDGAGSVVWALLDDSDDQ